MLTTHAVGIDLGTTYSCIAYLNEHGEPVTLPNDEGELSTPSVVLFEDGKPVVGTEALRNAILHPKNVVQNSKRFIGDPTPRWKIDDKPYSPVEIAALILKKLISAAQNKIGTIEQAVVTVPAQFSDAQRHATIEAGLRAGLQRVDIINEPVAAALCYVLGTEGLWFTELADEQRILVYDLGGGTFDLSLVKYQQNEVSVIASSGDLHLGGIDWNRLLLTNIAKQFSREFKHDPREDESSYQALANEVELTKRGLSVRPKAALTCQHGGQRKTYQVTLPQFEKMTKRLVSRTADITKKLLKDNKMGWAHVDVVLLTGGASRMPMIRHQMKDLSGRTMNTSLSPDQSIAHGATYYAGMLLTNNKFAKSILSQQANERLKQVKQLSVNARALGILIRDTKSDMRVPYYLVDENTTLPVSITENFGTVVPNQKRVHLQIVESGTTREEAHVKLGNCVIEDLPENLPVDSEIAVTIRYDEQARVHVSAKDVTSGKQATSEIIRQENLVPQIASEQHLDEDVHLSKSATAEKSEKPAAEPSAHTKRTPQAEAAEGKPKPHPKATRNKSSEKLEQADKPIPLCNQCGTPLAVTGHCPECGPAKPVKKEKRTPVRSKKKAVQQRSRKGATQQKSGKPQPIQKQPATKKKRKPSKKTGKSRTDPTEIGEDEFWEIIDAE